MLLRGGGPRTPQTAARKEFETHASAAPQPPSPTPTTSSARSATVSARSSTTPTPVPPAPITLTSFGYLHQPTDADGHPTPHTAHRRPHRGRTRAPARPRRRPRNPGPGRPPPPRPGRRPCHAGAPELLDNLTAYALLPAGPRRIPIGCAGGDAAGMRTGRTARPAHPGVRRPVTVEHLHAPSRASSRPTVSQPA
jgi:hypothetical protein